MIKDRGGVDVEACPNPFGRGMIKCRCKPLCKWCGYRKHAAIHGKVIGGGDRPWGHMYEPKEGR